MSAPILVTKSDLSRDLNVDPRRKAFDNLEPVAQAKLEGGKLVKLYNREEAKKILAEALREAAEKYSQDNFEQQKHLLVMLNVFDVTPITFIRMNRCITIAFAAIAKSLSGQSCAQEAVRRFGAGTAASRCITGLARIWSSSAPPCS